jgi:hypothetical protein
MSKSTSSVLDDAFDRMAAGSAFELPNGFVNHGPMACEALDALGLDEVVDEWARRFERVPGPAVVPVPTPDLDWRGALGDIARLPEWIGHFQIAIDEDGWAQVVKVWVPRLLPGLSTRLFHGAIRVGHAVRALTHADTPSRRDEVARALGYWAARYAPGQPISGPAVANDGDVRTAVADAAAEGARRYLAEPNILNLHGVTGAMAVDLLVDHIPPDAAAAGLAHVRAEHAALYRDVAPLADVRSESVAEAELARAAEVSGDVHTVKLVEACRRGMTITGDPAFAAAAELVTGLG